MAVLHAKALWNNTELGKAQSFIQVQGMGVRGNDGIELKNAEPKTGS